MIVLIIEIDPTFPLRAGFIFRLFIHAASLGCTVYPSGQRRFYEPRTQLGIWQNDLCVTHPSQQGASIKANS